MLHHGALAIECKHLLGAALAAQRPEAGTTASGQDDGIEVFHQFRFSKGSATPRCFALALRSRGLGARFVLTLFFSLLVAGHRLRHLDLFLRQTDMQVFQVLLRTNSEIVNACRNHDCLTARKWDWIFVFRQNRSEEHTSELQSHLNLVCRLLLEKKKNKTQLTVANHLSRKSTAIIFGSIR